MRRSGSEGGSAEEMGGGGGVGDEAGRFAGPAAGSGPRETAAAAAGARPNLVWRCQIRGLRLLHRHLRRIEEASDGRFRVEACRAEAALQREAEKRQRVP
ncbi:unnamed protein product [Musa textilis]